MIANIKLGVIVHTISITFPCTILTKLFFSWLNRTATLKSKYNTKIQTITKKNITSWWRSTIPIAIGVAGSWNPNCQGCIESQVAFTPEKKLIIISNIERVFDSSGLHASAGCSADQHTAHIKFMCIYTWYYSFRCRNDCECWTFSISWSEINFISRNNKQVPSNSWFLVFVFKHNHDRARPTRIKTVTSYISVLL